MDNIADKFRIKESLRDKRKKSENSKSIDRCGFIKGPIPLNWLKIAFELPLCALRISLVLWYVSGLQKSKTFTLTSAQVKKFNFSRKTKCEGLRYLERALLIKVKRQKGKNPIITIIDK